MKHNNFYLLISHRNTRLLSSLLLLFIFFLSLSITPLIDDCYAKNRKPASLLFITGEVPGTNANANININTNINVNTTQPKMQGPEELPTHRSFVYYFIIFIFITLPIVLFFYLTYFNKKSPPPHK
ncbi:MAG: hypothetical protein HQK49_11265 [Oligoflexia bacterium]|nr:hypothetical protein [Oligoflexia bacterium]